jgi:AcrR family transcriptional regulator
VHIGYHGATIREIAARAGLSVSGIHHYYTSKQHMLLRLPEYTMDDLLRAPGDARDEGRDPVEQFSSLVARLAVFHTHRADLGLVGAAAAMSARRRCRARRRSPCGTGPAGGTPRRDLPRCAPDEGRGITRRVIAPVPGLGQARSRHHTTRRPR